MQADPPATGLRALGVVAAGIAASLLVGYADVVTGELRLTTVYVAIIFGATWLTGRTIGILLAAVDLACVVVANPPPALAGQSLAHYIVETAGTAIIFFACVFMADRLRASIARERQQNTNLARYLPAEIARLLASEGMAAMRPRRLYAAILFMDIRNFTAMVRTKAPTDLFAFLQAYRTLISRIIEEDGGIVDKFVGDGTLAVFGAVQPSTTDAAAAIRCGERLARAIDDWNVERAGRGEEAVKVGIGIHYGETIVGAIGDERRLEYTVLGHAVNVASRIENLTKKYGLPLLVSEDALEMAAGNGISFDAWRRLVDSDVPGICGALRLAHPAPPRAIANAEAMQLLR